MSDADYAPASGPERGQRLEHDFSRLRVHASADAQHVEPSGLNAQALAETLAFPPSIGLVQRQATGPGIDDLERMAELKSRDPELEEAKRKLEEEVAQLDEAMERNSRPALPVEERENKRMSSEARWALYQEYLDRRWTGASQRERLTALRRWNFYLTREEFDRFQVENPDFKAHYDRFVKFYSQESAGFNIDTAHIGQVAGQPISGSSIEEYRSKEASIGLAQRHREAVAIPFQTVLTGLPSRISNLLKVIASYELGVKGVEGATGERSGASLTDLAAGRSKEVAGESLTEGERVRRMMDILVSAISKRSGEPGGTAIDTAWKLVSDQGEKSGE